MLKYGLPQLFETVAARKGLALAVVIDSSGSTPQVPGAWALFSEKGLEQGTVGGGILEARVEEAAVASLGDGKARVAEFRLDADPDDKEGAICGGAVTVLIDPGTDEARPTFEKARKGLKERRPGVLLTVITRLEGEFARVRREWVPESDLSKGTSVEGTGVPARDLGNILRSGPPGLFRAGDTLRFADPVRPLPRLIIAGAGHVGKAVAHLGRLLEFGVVVIDDRPEFAQSDNVPDADSLIVGDISASLREIPDSWDDFIVIVTRGHRNDAEALRACIRRKAAYVGMIGSRTKVSLMRREFLESGWAAAEEWDRVHTPIGLDIGSRTVEEIAVSIAAELVLARSRRRGGGQA